MNIITLYTLFGLKNNIFLLSQFIRINLITFILRRLYIYISIVKKVLKSKIVNKKIDYNSLTYVGEEKINVNIQLSTALDTKTNK